MFETISKTNASSAFFNARLDEIRISNHDRMRAKASFARAEAFADAIAGIINLVKYLLESFVVRPILHLTASIGRAG